jgi:16S rRNA (uracil1498-N3)-methyltransferase
MRLHRFMVSTDLSKSVVEIRDFNLLHQIRLVLRLKEGDQLILVGEKKEAVAKIIKYSEGLAVLEILSREKITVGSKRSAVLYVSVLKRENFELVVQKATEIGISKIVPMICARTVKTGLRQDRLEKIAKEAAEQCGRVSIPEISEIQNFSDILKSAPKNSFIFGLDAKKTAMDFKFPKEANLFIGPEGGWVGEELTAAKKAGFKELSLGPLVLRAETAAIVSSFLAVNL